MKISKNNDELQEFLDLSPDIFFKINLDGFLEYLSPSAENLFQGAKEKWNSDKKSFLTDNPANNESLLKIISLAKQGNPITPCKLEVTNKVGNEVILEVHGKPIFEHGKVSTYVGLARDISGLIKAEKSEK